MGNLCSIFYERHEQIKFLTGSAAKAEFLSKCIYWWQISTYKLKTSDHIWFTQTTRELAQKAGLSESSITRYLSFYVKADLIEKKVCKRYSKKHGHEITCLHIRITEKLLHILRSSHKILPARVELPAVLTTTDDTEIVNLTHPLYKENKNKRNNIDVRKQISVNSVDKKIKKTVYPIEKAIGERVTTELKNQVKGMMVNVEKQGKVHISDKEQVFSEIIFSLSNPQQFQGIDCFKYKLNIIASLLKNNAWKTPYGFYNHWDIGKLFKEKRASQARKWLSIKGSCEYGLNPDSLEDEKSDSEYSDTSSQQQMAIHQAIFKTGERLSRLEAENTANPRLRNALKKMLSRLYAQQRFFESATEAC